MLDFISLTDPEIINFATLELVEYILKHPNTTFHYKIALVLIS